MMDKKIVSEMDQKVIDQQNTLEKAGVPGFYITTNPQVNVNTCQLTFATMHIESTMVRLDTLCNVDLYPADGDV